MKRNIIVKILLDIVMVVLYLLLMFAEDLGGFFHETVGIGIGLLFVIHILLNISMIKGLFKAIKNGGAKIDRKILALSDIALVVCMPVVILTGILIAKELFILPNVTHIHFIGDIHEFFSFVCLALMGVHILFHGKYLVGVAKKLPSALKSKEMAVALRRFGAGALVAVILYVGLLLHKINEDKPVSYIRSNKKIATRNFADTTSKPPFNEKTTVPTTIEEYTENVEEDTEVITEQETEDIPSLEEYLGNLVCDGCGKRCVLLYPRCGRGMEKAYQAEEEYIQMYGDNY
ncbi:MAG: DUF4405 domain-containing protein [Ruminococcus sp.]